MENLFFTLNAILPVVLLILAGHAIRRFDLLPESFFSQLNRLCFHVCLPVMLFLNIYNVTDISIIIENKKIAFFSVAAVVTAFFIGLILVVFSVKKTEQKGVVLQCVFRSNYAIIGLPLAACLCNEGTIPMARACVVAAVSVPIFNVLATIALSVFTNKKNISFIEITKKILTNPLVLGTLTGILALFIRNILPQDQNNQPVFTIQRNLPFLYNAIKMISATASPIALIALGGVFSFSAVAKLKNMILLGTTMRLIVIPAIMLTAAWMLGFREHDFPSLIVLFGTPVAVSSVPMSAEMNGDTELASQLVVWTTIFSSVSLFVIVFICATVGLVG